MSRFAYTLILLLCGCSSTPLGNALPPPPAGGSGPPPGSGSGGGGGDAGGGAAAYYTTRDGNILTPDGNTLVTLRGVTWDGYAGDPNGLLAGLNAGTDNIAGDFLTQVQRLQDLGFNTVRLPFNFGDLNTLTPHTATSGCTVLSAQALQANLTNPQVVAQGNFPTPPTPLPQCNTYFPITNSLARLSYVVNALLDNNFYVLLTNAAASDTSVTSDPNRWVNQWAELLGQLATNPNTANRLWIDPLDEPDALGLGWEAAASGFPGMGAQYLAVMQAVTTVKPGTLFFLQGMGQAAAGANPGDGFVTNSIQITAQGLSNPLPFFTSLAGKAYQNRVVLAPHVAPPSLTGNANDCNSALWTRLDNSFGAVNRAGISTAAGVVKLPVMLVFGSALASADQAAMRSLASYMNNTAPAQDSTHNAITSWTWQAWNSSHAGTGGIVDSDGKSIVWDKIDYLTGAQPYPTALGLLPWYLQQ